MKWDHDNEADLDARAMPGPSHDEEERYEETPEDRKALLAELRRQIQSGTYRPSIGRISVSICGDLSGE